MLTWFSSYFLELLSSTREHVWCVILGSVFNFLLGQGHKCSACSLSCGLVVFTGLSLSFTFIARHFFKTFFWGLLVYCNSREISGVQLCAAGRWDCRLTGSNIIWVLKKRFITLDDFSWTSCFYSHATRTGENDRRIFVKIRIPNHTLRSRILFKAGFYKHTSQ